MEDLLGFIGENEGLLAYGILCLSAAIEYVLPPFPGDTVTLFGAFLVVTEGWSMAAIFASVTAGSLAGAAFDYWVGVRLARDTSGRTRLSRRWAKTLSRVEPVIARLRQRGAAYIVWNRFLPGIRALFFVAAGMAGLRLKAVLFYAAVSAVAWNVLVMAAGIGLGASWEKLRLASGVYSALAWGLIVAAALVLVARRLRRRAAIEIGEEESPTGGAD